MRSEAVPEFLQRALQVPLAERRAESARIAADYSSSGETIALPDEAAGVYSGVIRVVLPHYSLQQTGATTLEIYFTRGQYRVT